MPLTGVRNTVKYTTSGLKNGKIVAVSSRFWAPKMTGSSEGMPTSRLSEMTSFAVVFELPIRRNNTRSHRSPMSGDMTTTETTKAGKPDHPLIWVRYVNTNAAAYACAPKAKLKTPVAWNVRTRPTATIA